MIAHTRSHNVIKRHLEIRFILGKYTTPRERNDQYRSLDDELSYKLLYEKNVFMCGYLLLLVFSLPI